MRTKPYKYEQTKKDLIELVSELSEGAPLPNRNKLVEKFGIARTTLERAISELIGEGILVSYDGRGTYAATGDARCASAYRSADKAEAAEALDEHLWGLLVYSVTKGITPLILRGIEDFAHERDINVLVCNTDNDPKRELECLKMLYSRSIAGIIVIPSTHSSPNWEVYEDIKNKGISITACSRQVPGYNFPGAFQNFFQNGFCATQHLLDMGCRRIAYLAASQYCTIEDRLQGYLAALAQHNAQHPQDQAADAIGLNRTSDDIKAWIRDFLRAHRDIDGIYVFNDRLAMLLYAVLRELKLVPGRDIRIVSGENSGFCDAFVPTLSSVDVPAYEMGRIAAEQLWKLRRGDNDSEDRHFVLGGELRRRESSAGMEDPAQDV